jgi:uncharacterized protein DUF6940
MWDVRAQSDPSGIRVKISHEGARLSFREVFFLLESSTDFARWYSEILAACVHEAYFWELPPLTTATFEDDAEFVVIESDSLARLRPDPAPFESQFALQRGSDVITFPNLGGDALLIVPTPLGSVESYPHLATFLRQAPASQVRSLWKGAARAVHETLSDTPTWLSTAGLGVSWLHLRLDTRPKYYNYQPYKTAA